MGEKIKRYSWRKPKNIALPKMKPLIDLIWRDYWKEWERIVKEKYKK